MSMRITIFFKRGNVFLADAFFIRINQKSKQAKIPWIHCKQMANYVQSEMIRKSQGKKYIDFGNLVDFWRKTELRLIVMLSFGLIGLIYPKTIVLSFYRAAAVSLYRSQHSTLAKYNIVSFDRFSKVAAWDFQRRCTIFHHFLQKQLKTLWQVV